VGLSAVLVTANLAFAQGTNGSAPLQLVPGKDLTAPGGDAAGQPGSGDAPAAPQSESPTKQGIEILSLGQFDAGAIGVVDAEASGFGSTPWAGTKRAAAVRLLNHLPVDTGSAVLQELGERLLLSGTSPQGDGEAFVGLAPSFLDLRLQQLFSWGRTEEVLALLALVPRSRQSEVTGRVWVRALLAAAQDQAACHLVRREIVAYHTQIFWAKALIFCQILAGEVEQAFLGLDLLREKGVDDDPLFTDLAYRFAGADAKITETSLASVLNFAMMRHLDIPVPDGFAAAAPRALWPALVGSIKVGPRQRAALAEAAFRGDLIDAEALAEAYRSISFSAGELSSAVSRRAGSSGAAGRALLFQAAEAQSLVISRVELLRTLLETAQAEQHYDTALGVAAPMLHDLRPRTDLTWFAESAARAFYVLGQVERARAWVRLVERDAQTSPEGQAALGRLWPLARLNGDPTLLPDHHLAAWAAEVATDNEGAEEGTATRLRQQYLLLASFHAMGTTDPTLWTALSGWDVAEETLGVKYPLLLALREASAAKKVGETLLLALALVGERTWSEIAVVEANEILAALHGLDLSREVRRMAFEIALANGL
jgi:hypothetical protein